MKPTLPIQLVRLAALAVAGVAAITTQAVPYASSVVSNNNTVTFVLNQAAAGITVLTNGVAVTPPIDASTPGLKSFDMTGATTYSIIVTGNTAKAWTQFIPDGTDRNFYFPNSVAINKNPASTNFGKVYIGNNNQVIPGNTGAGRLTTDGIFLLRADGVAISGPHTGGVSTYMTNDLNNYSNPFKINLNPDDDCLYFTSYYDDLAFGFNADLSVATQLIDAGNKTAGQYVESIYATGKQSDGTRKIYTVDSHYLDPRVGLIQYDLFGNATATALDTGTQLIGPSFYTYYPCDVDRDSSGNWYLTQYRAAAGQAPVVNKFDGSLAPPINTSLWNASAAYTYARCVGVNETGGTVAVGRVIGSSGLVYFFDIATGAFKEQLDVGNYVRDIAFDKAGNMVSVDNSLEYARFWSPGGYTVAITKSDATFQLLQTDNLSVTATDDAGAEEGPDAAVFTITRSGGPAGDLLVSFTMSGTAVSNVDYTISPSSPFTFASGETSTNITITPNNDVAREALETVVLTLSPGGNLYSAVNPTTATATITDNDVQLRYWDADGATTGAGGATPTGTWGTDNFWGTNSLGEASTAAWTNWEAAVFSANADAVGAFTVTLSSPQQADYVSFEEGDVTLTGSSLTLTNFDPVKVAFGLTATIDSVLDGGAGLWLNGEGTLVLGANNTYSGSTLIETGTVRLAAADRIPDSSEVNIGSGGILDLNNFSETIGSLAGSAGAVVTVPPLQTLTFGGNNSSTTWNGSANGGFGGSLLKVGTGKTTIGSAGVIGDPLSISNGAVAFGGAAQLGGAVANAIGIDNNAILEGTSVGVGVDFIGPNKTITLGANGGTVKVTDAGAILFVRDFSVISGPGTLTKDGPGELRTHTVEHSFGKLIVKEGLYTAGHSTLLGFNTSFGAIPGVLTPDAITLTNGSQIRKAGGQNVILHPFQGITLQTGGGVIRAYSGSLPQDTGAFVITGPVSGVGKLTLNSTVEAGFAPIVVLGAGNTYAGGTALRAGTLYVTNTVGSATGSGSVNVTNATLGGDGIIGGPVFMAGGSLSPGYSFNTGPQPVTPVVKTIAKLTLTNGLNMSLGATKVWQLGEFSTSNPGTDFDQVELTGGNLTLGGSSALSINFANNAAAPSVTNMLWLLNREWTIVKLTGTAANPGSTKFTTLQNGNYPGVGSFTNYADAGGNIILKFVTAVTNIPPVINPSVAGAGSGNSIVSWSSYPGVSYTVLYASNLNAPIYWNFLTNISGEPGATTAILDDASGYQTQRYYRVIIP